MSDTVNVQDTYDFTKQIKDINLSTTYIFALEQLIIFMLTRSEDPGQSLTTFKKFEAYIAGELDLEKNPFSEEEAHLYTVFSLQQLFKAKAYEQGLNVKIDATIDQSLVEELLKAAASGDFDKFSEINAKMNEHVQNQLS